MEKQVFEIRGHHLESLQQFIHAKKNNLPIFKNSGYGNSFDSNRDAIYYALLRRNPSIKITAKFDSLCDKCYFKTELGCVYEHIEYGKVFQKKEFTQKVDIKIIKKFNLKLNKIYSGKEISDSLLKGY